MGADGFVLMLHHLVVLHFGYARVENIQKRQTHDPQESFPPSAFLPLDSLEPRYSPLLGYSG